MAATGSYPHIEKLVGEPARLKRLPRIRVAQIVMDQLAYGWSAEEMCRQHPYLTLAEAYGAMLYYLDHQEEIDREIASEWQEAKEDQILAPSARFLARMRAKGLV